MVVGTERMNDDCVNDCREEMDLVMSELQGEESRKLEVWFDCE